MTMMDLESNSVGVGYGAGDSGRSIGATRTLHGPLTEIWEDILGLSSAELDPNMSFFELGGYSLLAIQAVEQINQKLGVNAPPTAVLEYPTINVLSDYLSTLANGDTDTEQEAVSSRSVNLNAVEEGECFQLTELQQAYWIGEKSIYQLDTPATWFTEYEARELDTVRFVQALNRLIEIHPMLRAVFTQNAEQRILPSVPSFPLSEIQLQGESEEEYKDAVSKERARVSKGGGNITKWPLFEISVIRSQTRPIRVLLGGRLIILDGRSGEIFARDLMKLYLGRELKVPGISFPAYVKHVKETLIESNQKAKSELERARSYWLNRLDVLPPAPELPKRPGEQAIPGPMKRRAYRLCANDWQSVQKKASAQGVTPTIVLCGAFSWIISKWSSSEEFTINMMYGKREAVHPDVNEVIGNFSDTLLLVFRRKESFAESLQALQKQLFQDLEHGAFPGTSVIRELARKQDSSRNNPLMPYVFASGLGMAREREEYDEFFFMEKFGWSAIDSSIQTPQVLLDHQVIESKGELVLQWDSRDDAFPEGLIEDMFNAYVTLLHDLASNDQVFWNRPGIILNAQIEHRKRVNSIPGSADRFQLLHQGFLDQVSENPEKVALIFSNDSCTYGEIYRDAAKVATFLRMCGVKPGEPVIVHFPKGRDQIVGCLGILMSGGAYVPISHDQPESRIDQILEACKPRFAIVDSSLSTRGVYQIRNVEIMGRIDSLSIDDELLKDTNTHPSHLAYIIFTSGSTGTPKGVAITHEAAMNTILDINARFDISDKDKAIAVSELNFDLSVYDLFGMFRAGGTVVVPDHAHSRNPIHLAQMVEDHKVTVWNSVPAYVEMMVEYTAMRGIASLSFLKKIMMSGDWIPMNLPEKIRNASPGAKMISMGGATEASIWSNYYVIEKLDPNWVSIPYGVPLAGQSFHVLDSQFEDCPDWVHGELYIGGNGVALGYFGDEERTKAQFVMHPKTGERLYRTGDWGRYYPGGVLEFLGRKDGQVKLRGHRVEIGEVEATLKKIDGVKEAIVIAKGGANDKRLVAFVLMSTADNVSIATIKTAIREVLPSYMQPSAYHTIETIPLTANGKVNRKMLAEMELNPVSHEADEKEYSEIKGEWERRIHDIWVDLLGHQTISAKAGFFEVGGNSITAIRMMTRLEKETGLSLPIDLVHRNPSIRSLAESLSIKSESAPVLAMKLGDSRESLTVFSPHPVGGNVFCYWGFQKRLPFSFVGLQARGVVPGWTPQNSITEMAETYLESIRPMLPEGVINFIGWSMGGMISLEIAKLLEIEGRECRVVMLDTWVSREDKADVSEVESLISFFHDLSGGRIPDLADRIKHLSVDVALKVGARALIDSEIIGQEMDENVISRLFKVFRVNSLAIHNHEGSLIKSDVLLFQSTVRNHERFHDLRPLAEDSRWRSCCPSLKVEEFEGDHFQIVSGNAIELMSDRIKVFFEKGLR